MGWQVDENGNSVYVSDTPTNYGGDVDAGYYDTYRSTNTPAGGMVLGNTPAPEPTLTDYMRAAENKMGQMGMTWMTSPVSTSGGADASWGRKGYPTETSASLIGSGSGLSRYGGRGGYAIGGGLGLGRTTNPMPYFEGLKDQMGMPISQTDPKYWKMPDRPTLNIPTYTPTARNEGRISELSQKAGAVGMGKLGRALTAALSQARGMGDNPMAEQITRSALRGYGEGLDSVMGQAQQTGLQQYEQEYRALEEANKINYEGKMKSSLADYQTENQRINAMYEAALKDYFGR